MAMFRYKAMTPSGVMVRGTIAAASERAAVEQIRANGHYPVATSLADGRDLKSMFRSAFGISPRLSLRRLTATTEQIADLLAAGLELDRVLGVVADLEDAQELRGTFLTVRKKVREGTMLADALSAEPAMPRFYVSMVRAGELGGQLGLTMKKLAEYLARTQAIRDAVISALIYPVILLLTAGLSVVFLLTFVLPSFEPLFASTGQSLPLPTAIVITISRGFRHFWWAGAGLAILFALWGRKALQDSTNRAKWDARLLKLPRIGQLLTDIELERFKRMLGTLITSGVAVPTALQLSKDVVRNRTIAAAISAAAISLREGGSLARLLAKSGYFPGAMLDLIRIGEETGRLDEMLLRQADLDERRIRHEVDRLIALLVPALTILLGLIVAGLIASMLVAILGVNDIALQ
jgi:general secretion pathway protein F